MWKLVEWDHEGYVFTIEDAIFSLLIDNPTEFYITPNEQVVYIIFQGRGLIRILHDCRGMDDEQINHLIYHIMRGT